MGFENRDYMRRSGRFSDRWDSSFGGGAWPPVVKYIIWANVAIFILQIMMTREATQADIDAQMDEGEDAYVEQRVRQQEIAQQVRSRDQYDRDADDKYLADENDSERSHSERDRNERERDDRKRDRSADNREDVATDDGSHDEADADKDRVLTLPEMKRKARREYREMMAESLAWQPKVSIIQEAFELDTKKVMRGQIWRVVTSAFCHDRMGVFHILFNMLALYWFGIKLERMYGSREFLIFYLSAAVIASLAYIALDLYTGRSVPAIGASGAVMGVFMLFVCHFPHYTLRFNFLFPIEARWILLIYVIYDLHPVLLALAGDSMFTGIAHAAHLGGLAFGYWYYKTNTRLEPVWDKIARFDFAGLFNSGGRGSHLRLHSGSSQRDGRNEEDTEMDAILAKISSDGLDSLSDEEKKKLEESSERLRERKD